MIPALTNHLWQSTIFAGVAGLFTLALRRNQAAARYWLWLAASLKFLFPFSWLVVAGSQMHWRTAAPAQVALAMQQAEPLLAPALPSAPASAVDLITPGLLAAWGCGFVAVLLFWFRRWRRMRAVLRGASPLDIAAPIRVKSSSSFFEPGVFGIFRPVLLLPNGIADRLTGEELQSIVAHECAHVRRRDNLAAALHMLVEALFWFYPLVWWIGARLVEERERACDEAVSSDGHDPGVYAGGILKVCRLYLETPLPCVAGVTGSDLRKRIERIVRSASSRRLEPGKKLLLALASAAALALPIGFGALNATPGLGQSQSSDEPRPSFEVASIKPGDSKAPRFGIGLMPGGKFTAHDATLRQLIAFAFNLRGDQISSGPPWYDSVTYSIEATPAEALPKAIGQEGALRVRRMVQSLLLTRFGLVFHWETKEEPTYELVVAKGGPKFKESAEGTNESERIGIGKITEAAVPISQFAQPLSQLIGRSVIDRTGLTGKYDLSLEWTPSTALFRFPDAQPGPDAADPGGASVFTALQEQLGLKLESARGPVEILVIDRAEKPSAN